MSRSALAQALVSLAALAVLAACGSSKAPPSAAARPPPPAAPPSRCGAAPAQKVRQVIQSGGTSFIAALDFARASTGDHLAVASNDGSVRIWDARTRGLLRELRHGDLVRGKDLGLASVAWAPDRDVLAIAGPGRGLLVDSSGCEVGRFDPGVEGLQTVPYEGAPGWLWMDDSSGQLSWTDGARGAQIPMLVRGSEMISASSLAASSDGSMVAWLPYGWAASGMWMAPLVRGATPRKLKLPATPAAVALSSHGDFAVVGTKTSLDDDGEPSIPAYVVDLRREPAAVRELDKGRRNFHDIAISPDDRLAAGASADLVVWNLGTGKSWRQRASDLARDASAENSRFYYVSFSPGGERLAAATTGEVHLFESASGRYIGRLGEELRAPERLIFLDSDHLVALAGTRATKWSLRSGCVLRHDSIPHLADARRQDDGLVLPWVNEPGEPGSCRSEEIELHVDTWLGLSLGPTQPRACRDPGADIPAGEATLETPTATTCLETGMEIQDPTWTYDPARRRVFYSAIAGEREDTELMFVDLDEPRPTQLEGSLNADYVALSGDSRWIAAIVQDAAGRKRLAAWDAGTGARLGEVMPPDAVAAQMTFMPPDPSITEVVLSDDGRRLAASSCDGISMWELPSLRPVFERLPLRGGVAGAVTALTFAKRDASRWVAGTSDGGLWIYRDGTFLRQGGSEGGRILRAEVSPDDAVVATISDDGAVRIWGLEDARLRATLVDFSDDEYLAFSPGGAFRGTREAAERVGFVFDAPLELFRFEQFYRQYHRPAAVIDSLLGAAADPGIAVARPPRIQIVSKPGPGAGSESVIGVHIKGESEIEKVQVFAEGRPLGQPVPVGARERRVEVRVRPPAGPNRLELVAFDRAGMASNAATVDVNGEERRRPRLWIVTIGIKKYPKLHGFKALRYADADAGSLAATLSARARPTYDSVRVTKLLDDDATVGSILKELSALSEMAPEDVAVVFFSGHGVRAGSGDDMLFLTGQVEARAGVPVSASVAQHAIGWSRIADVLRNARGRVLVLLDACHAGAFNREVVVPNDALARRLVRDERSGVVVFASSKGRQRSREMTLPPPGGGLFRLKIEASLSSPDADRDGDGVLRLSEIVDDVTFSVHRASQGEQTPWIARRETFSDFKLFERSTAPAPPSPEGQP